MSYLGNQNYVMANMTQQLPHNYISTSNPTIDVNPPILNMTWLNSTTSEIFVCSDNTVGENIWVGQIGSIIPSRYALSFDGVDDYIECGNGSSFDVDDITIEFKYTTTTIPTVGGFCSKRISSEQNGNYSFRFHDDTGKLELKIWDGDTNPEFIGSIILDPYTEYHIAMSLRDADSQCIFYVNGEIDVQGTHGGKLINCIEDFKIGSEGETYFDNGVISEFRVWSTIRTQQDIVDNIDLSLDGDEVGLVAYYPVIGTETVALADATGNGNDGTIYGATVVRNISTVVHNAWEEVI